MISYYIMDDEYRYRIKDKQGQIPGRIISVQEIGQKSCDGKTILRRQKKPNMLPADQLTSFFFSRSCPVPVNY